MRRSSAPRWCWSSAARWAWSRSSPAATGRILGASIFGAGAGDLILPWALAISQKLKIGALANLVVPYPTRGEAGKRAAGSFYTPALFSPRTRRIVRFLARFG